MSQQLKRLVAGHFEVMPGDTFRPAFPEHPWDLFFFFFSPLALAFLLPGMLGLRRRFTGQITTTDCFFLYKDLLRAWHGKQRAACFNTLWDMPSYPKTDTQSTKETWSGRAVRPPIKPEGGKECNAGMPHDLGKSPASPIAHALRRQRV